jgi:hypothetical protein
MSSHPIRLGDEKYQLIRAYVEASDEVQQSCYVIVPDKAVVEVSPLPSDSLVVAGESPSVPPASPNVLWRVSVAGDSVSVGEGTLVFYGAGWDQHVFAPVVLSFDPGKDDLLPAAIARIASYQSALKAIRR